LACPDCDTLFAAPAVEEGEQVLCAQCGASLFHYRRNSLHRAAALTVAAAFLFLVANAFPFMTLQAGFRESQMILSQSVSGLEHEDSPYLGAAVAIFTLGAPALIIGGLMYLLLPLHAGRRLPGAIPLCRWVYRARKWNMVEVFLLGALVSLLKLGKLATLTLGISFWAFVGLIICLTAALSSIDYRELWTRLENARP
jgi:paraquat-inducible protein A